jgi:hypothetical protein
VGTGNRSTFLRHQRYGSGTRCPRTRPRFSGGAGASSSWVRQPFRQAYREFYEVTDDERETKLYSNRSAGTLMRQHEFSSLCRARGWNYRLMGTRDICNESNRRRNHSTIRES